MAVKISFGRHGKGGLQATKIFTQATAYFSLDSHATLFKESCQKSNDQQDDSPRNIHCMGICQ